MKGQIKRLLAILFVVLFVATLTASAVSTDPDEHWCGNDPYWRIPHSHISEQSGIISVGNEIQIENVRIASMK
jgi:hypothetical protein